MGLILGILILLTCLVYSVTLGAAEIPLNKILESFITFDGSYEHLVIQTVRLPRSLVALVVGSSLAVAGALMQGLTRNPDHTFVIYNLRLPRTLVAFMVGMALAVSGTIFQGITHNPLADPGIIGINAGASLAAVIVIVLFPSAPIYTLPVSAFVGALLIAGLIYSLAWNNGSSPVLFILMGVGLSAIASAFTSLLITFGDIYSVSDALVWLAGSVYGRTWEQVFSFLPWLIVFIPMALTLARHLNALNLGDDVAKGLGSRVEWQRGLLVLVSVALAGAGVATAGMIGFVGLITPHLGRQLVGTNHEGLIPTSALLGGMLVVVADFLGRTLFAPIEIPCGVVTAAVGAPYFLYLLIRNRKK